MIGIPDGVKDAYRDFRRRSRLAFPILLIWIVAWSAALSFLILPFVDPIGELPPVEQSRGGWQPVFVALGWLSCTFAVVQFFFKFLGPDSRDRQWPKKLSFPPAARPSIFRDVD